MTGPALSTLHRALRLQPTPAESLVVGIETIVHPKDLLDHKVTSWHQLWSPKDQDTDGLADIFDRILIKVHERGGLPPLTGEDVRRALQRQRAYTVMGADRLSPTDLLRLPNEALEELACIFNTMEQLQAWPHQLLMTIGAMRAKKDNGDRIIGLLPGGRGAELEQGVLRPLGRSYKRQLGSEGGLRQGPTGGADRLRPRSTGPWIP